MRFIIRDVNDFFQLSARGSSVSRELRGALATFLTMAYILFVNPKILSDAGVPFSAAAASTALAAGICCILMGLIANFPIALASGMGLNAFVAFTIAPKVGWHVAMGVIVLNGLVTLILVLGGLREAILRAIPRDLRLAIGAGIGLFIALLGLSSAGIVVQGKGALLAPGNLHDPMTLIAIAGLIITATLMALRVTGAILIGIIASTAIAYLMHLTKLPHGWNQSWTKPDFSAMFHADVIGAIKWNWREMLPILFSVIMVDFFDTLGTATAIAEEGGMIDNDGNIPGIRSVLMVDSISASIGGLLGASSCTSYIESASGVAEGARTGLHSVFVGVFFLAAMFFSPWLGIVPAAATAPALILVGFLMLSQMVKVDFEDVASAIPAFITLITIPLTYSIAHGIGFGFIAYVAIKVLTLKPHKVHPLMYLTAAAFGAFFVWGKA